MVKQFLQILFLVIVNLSCQSRNRSLSGDTSDLSQRSSQQYVILAKRLHLASSTYRTAEPDKEQDLYYLAGHISDEEPEKLAEKMASPDYQTIMDAAKQEPPSSDSGLEQNVSKDKDKSKNITYAGIGVASLGMFSLAAGCLAQKAGYFKSFKKVGRFGAGAIVGGVALIVVNEGRNRLGLVEGSTDPRLVYLTELEEIGQELVAVKSQQGLGLTSLCKRGIKNTVEAVKIPKITESIDLKSPVQLEIAGKNLQIGGKIAQGGQDSIYDAIYAGENVVVKVGNVEDEIAVLNYLEKEGFSASPSVKTYFNDAKDQTVLVMEKLDKFHYSDEGVKSLLQNMEILHGKGIVHQDITPGNIMLRGKDPVYIDFGGANAETFPGTGFYSANGFEGEQRDVVALGRSLLSQKHAALIQEEAWKSVDYIKQQIEGPQGEFIKNLGISHTKILAHAKGKTDPADLQVYRAVFSAEQQVRAVLAKVNKSETDVLSTDLNHSQWGSIDQLKKAAYPSDQDFFAILLSKMKNNLPMDDLLLQMATGRYDSAHSALAALEKL